MANGTCGYAGRRPPAASAPPAGAGGGAGTAEVSLPAYTVGDKVATRKAYGQALAALGARPDVVALDGEVSDSTYAEMFAHARPDRYFEMFIAEQQLVAAAVGCSVRGYTPFASTFAAFFTRAYDFIRMAGISQVGIRLTGSHAGVEIGADGPSRIGPGGFGDDARRAGFHRARSQRRIECGRAGAGDGRPRRRDLPAHHPRRLPRALPR